MLDRADCADFGCHNSIRLETKHFLNTLALTFISFSGRFVFAMQKHYLFFFASDPLVKNKFVLVRNFLSHATHQWKSYRLEILKYIKIKEVEHMNKALPQAFICIIYTHLCDCIISIFHNALIHLLSLAC